MPYQSPESTKTVKKKNVLILMADQLQARVFDGTNPCITPNIDKLITRGLRFKNAYASNAVCSPARAGIMTGLLPHNHGVITIPHCVDKDQSCLRTEYPHWAQKLQAAGYNNAYFGKWHVEHTESPTDFGWSKDFSIHGKAWKQRAEEFMKRKDVIKGKKIIVPGYKESFLYGVTNISVENRGMGITTGLAMEYLQEACRKPDVPWCCFVSFSEPHDPFICGEAAYKLYNPDDFELPENFNTEHQSQMPGIYRKSASIFKDMSEQEKREAMACYYALITEIDQQFGKIIDQVENSGQLDDTLIVLISDHGELLGAHGLYCKNFSAYEEVYNIPLIFCGPGIKKGCASNARVGSHEFCPTILEYLGLEGIESADSKSFASLLTHPEATEEFQIGYAEYFGTRFYITQRVVWQGAWKYVFNGFDFDELYNLEQDPFELKNLAQDLQYKEKINEMATIMWERIKETGDSTLLNSHYSPLRIAPCGPGRESDRLYHK